MSGRITGGVRGAPDRSFTVCEAGEVDGVAAEHRAHVWGEAVNHAEAGGGVDGAGDRDLSPRHVECFLGVADVGRQSGLGVADGSPELAGEAVSDLQVGQCLVTREISRARRTRQPLTLAFVDIDGLKNRNDAQGHAAGDQLLRETAASIRLHFRPYDLMIRYGGDEFVCVLFDMDTTEATERFSLVNADLRAAQGAAVTIGLAMLTDDDELESLLQRADADMYENRQREAKRAG